MEPSDLVKDAKPVNSNNNNNSTTNNEKQPALIMPAIKRTRTKVHSGNRPRKHRGIIESNNTSYRRTRRSSINTIPTTTTAATAFPPPFVHSHRTTNRQRYTRAHPQPYTLSPPTNNHHLNRPLNSYTNLSHFQVSTQPFINPSHISYTPNIGVEISPPTTSFYSTENNHTISSNDSGLIPPEFDNPITLEKKRISLLVQLLETATAPEDIHMSRLAQKLHEHGLRIKKFRTFLNTHRSIFTASESGGVDVVKLKENYKQAVHEHFQSLDIEIPAPLGIDISRTSAPPLSNALPNQTLSSIKPLTSQVQSFLPNPPSTTMPSSPPHFSFTHNLDPSSPFTKQTQRLLLIVQSLEQAGPERELHMSRLAQILSDAGLSVKKFGSYLSNLPGIIQVKMGTIPTVGLADTYQTELQKLLTSIEAESARLSVIQSIEERGNKTCQTETEISSHKVVNESTQNVNEISEDVNETNQNPDQSNENPNEINENLKDIDQMKKEEPISQTFRDAPPNVVPPIETDDFIPLGSDTYEIEDEIEDEIEEEIIDDDYGSEITDSMSSVDSDENSSVSTSGASESDEEDVASLDGTSIVESKDEVNTDLDEVVDDEKPAESYQGNENDKAPLKIWFPNRSNGRFKHMKVTAEAIHDQMLKNKLGVPIWQDSAVSSVQVTPEMIGIAPPLTPEAETAATNSTIKLWKVDTYFGLSILNFKYFFYRSF